MKICIPTADDGGLEAVMADHFGRAPFLTMVDVPSGHVKVVRNPACHSRTQSCHHVPILEAHGVQAVACHRLGRRASSSLEASGIDVLETPSDASVQRIMALARAGELRPAHPEERCEGGHHRHGRRRGARGEPQA